MGVLHLFFIIDEMWLKKQVNQMVPVVNNILLALHLCVCSKLYYDLFMIYLSVTNCEFDMVYSAIVIVGHFMKIEMMTSQLRREKRNRCLNMLMVLCWVGWRVKVCIGQIVQRWNCMWCCQNVATILIL